MITSPSVRDNCHPHTDPCPGIPTNGAGWRHTLGDTHAATASAAAGESQPQAYPYAAATHPNTTAAAALGQTNVVLIAGPCSRQRPWPL